MSAETRAEERREQIANCLGEPDRLRFPSEWTTSASWHRAQAAPSSVGPANPAEFDTVTQIFQLDNAGKSRREIADAVDIPVATVQNVLNRREWYINREWTAES